jgi:dipeptidyl aminopeptidase/acylaminoacyl peptidase
LLPVGYQPGHAYPTIVVVYTNNLSGVLHHYLPPYGQPYSAYLQRGYAVLLPDIAPRLDAPGPAAVEAVTAAINAAAATGIVDRHHLGLFGHSYGGFETYYLVSHTDLFQAAVAEAGITDLWSDCGGTYGSVSPQTAPQAQIQACQIDQPYLSGPPWEDWPAFLTNSPLYYAQNIKTPLLMLHGDADEFVSFSQALSMFTTLRELGNRQAVLLEYVGADHNLANPEMSPWPDIDSRMMTFYDHFLRGTPAPKWWSDGITYAEGTAPASISSGVK